MPDHQIDRVDCRSEAVFQQWTDTVADLTSLHSLLGELRTLALNHVDVHGGFAQGTTTTKFKLVADTHYTLGGRNYKKAAADDVAQPASTTNGSQYAKDLISINASGTVTITAGTKAASQNAAVKPSCPDGDIELGWIEVPASFTPGTTDVTNGMLKQVVHSLSTQADLVTSIGS